MYENVKKFGVVIKVTIAKRLRHAMTQAGIPSEAELHRLSGVAQPTVHRILSGESKSPRHSNVEALARALRVSAYWLRVGDNNLTSNSTLKDPAPEGSKTTHQQKYPVDELEFIGKFNDSDNGTSLGEGGVEVPMYREVDLDSESGQTQVVESKGETKTLSKLMLKQAGILVENVACARVSGNSMEPVLPHGATVGVNTVEKKIIDGKLFAIDQNGMLRIKQVFRIPGGGIRLASFNKSEHPDEDYSQEYMAKNIRTIGRVFWYESFV
jgi:phage repressor protein C with HTH and peptisase S24 domain